MNTRTLAAVVSPAGALNTSGADLPALFERAAAQLSHADFLRLCLRFAPDLAVCIQSQRAWAQDLLDTVETVAEGKGSPDRVRAAQRRTLGLHHHQSSATGIAAAIAIIHLSGYARASGEKLAALPSVVGLFAIALREALVYCAAAGGEVCNDHGKHRPVHTVESAIALVVEALR